VDATFFLPLWLLYDNYYSLCLGGFSINDRKVKRKFLDENVSRDVKIRGKNLQGFFTEIIKLKIHRLDGESYMFLIYFRGILIMHV